MNIPTNNAVRSSKASLTLLRMEQPLPGDPTNSSSEKSDGSRSNAPGIVVDVKNTGNNQKRRQSVPTPAATGDEEIENASQNRPNAELRAQNGDSSIQGNLGEQLNSKEKKRIRKLKRRNREVRAHERAHMSAAQQYVTGGPSYDYVRGPNGKRYAVSGEVQFDMSAEEDPKETIEKMKAIKRAATAPAQPSQQDRRVAAQAQQKLQEARQELRKQQNQTGSSNELGQSTQNQKAGEATEGSDARQQIQSGGSEALGEPVNTPANQSRSEESISGLQNLRVNDLSFSMQPESTTARA